MNLKEAFRYQNKLQSFMDDAQSILDRDTNVTRVENTYLRHKVMTEAEDETVLAVPETDITRTGKNCTNTLIPVPSITGVMTTIKSSRR